MNKKIFYFSGSKKKRINDPNLHNLEKFDSNEIAKVLSNNTLALMKPWIKFQQEWMSNIYKKFKNPPNDLMLDLYPYYKVKKISNHKIIRFSVIQYERLYGVSSWKKNFLSYFDLSFKQFIGIIKIRFIK